VAPRPDEANVHTELGLACPSVRRGTEAASEMLRGAKLRAKAVAAASERAEGPDVHSRRTVVEAEARVTDAAVRRGRAAACAPGVVAEVAEEGVVSQGGAVVVGELPLERAAMGPRAGGEDGEELECPCEALHPREKIP